MVAPNIETPLLQKRLIHNFVNKNIIKKTKWEEHLNLGRQENLKDGE